MNLEKLPKQLADYLGPEQKRLRGELAAIAARDGADAAIEHAAWGLATLGMSNGAFLQGFDHIVQAVMSAKTLSEAQAGIAYFAKTFKSGMQQGIELAVKQDPK